MERPRRFPILSILCVSACLFVLAVVASQFIRLNEPSDDFASSSQAPQATHIPNHSRDSFRQPLPPVELSDDHEEPKPASDEKEANGEEVVGEAPQLVEAASRVADEVVLPTGPELSSGSEIRLSSAIQPEPPRASLEAISPPLETPLELPRPSPEANSTSLPARLSEWARRLPDLVAYLPTPSRLDAPFEPSASQEPHASPSSSKPSDVPVSDPGRQEKDSKPHEKLWHEPETLLHSLEALGVEGPTGLWAAEVARQIRRLGPAVADGTNEAEVILERLAKLNEQVVSSAASLDDKSLARAWRKTSFALARRIDIWKAAVRLAAARKTDNILPETDPAKLAQYVAEAEAHLGDSAEGVAWRKFLLLDALKECAAGRPAPNGKTPREIAATALARMTETPLEPAQQRLLVSAPLAALRVELRRWAAESIGVARALADIERYERTGLTADARRLALDCQSLLASQDRDSRELADRIDLHYRNANFRMAVTEQLLNQLIPDQQLELAPVRDRVVGWPTRGKSLMATEIAVRMIPDPQRVRLALEVTGEIAALTTTEAGPARFHNASESYYVARKPIEINMRGIRLWPVEVDVENETWLRGVETPLDGVWVLGPLAKSVARSQHEQTQPAAKRELKQKIVAKAAERIDAEARQRFSKFVEQMNHRVFEPLNSLALDPRLIDAETQETRFTMRLRLGGEDQLGGHTPRPQAPIDSLASVQLHESLINNGIGRLRLAGRTFTLPELSRHVAENLNCPALWETHPDNQDVKITFAEQNPVVVRLQDGRVALTLSIARLSKSPRRWTHFQIRAYYRPEVRGRSAELVRDDVIQLVGERLTVGSQIALRGIFSRALSKNAPLQLVPEAIVQQPKLADAAITQFVIDDGWIGLALGPKRPSATARRPRTTANR